MNLRCSATHQDLRAETTRSGHRSRQMLDYIGCSKLTRGLTAGHNRLRIGMCSETTSTCKQERILSRTCDTAPTASASNTMRARRTRRMSSFCVAAACSATVNRHFNLAARVALSVRCSATPGEKAAVVPSGTYTCTLGSQRCVWKSRSRAKTEAASRWCTPCGVSGWRCNSTFWPK
jgi:hypothetical protein